MSKMARYRSICEAGRWRIMRSPTLKFGVSVKPEAELLFHQLADLNPTQREQYFAEHQVSPEVRSEVEGGR